MYMIRVIYLLDCVAQDAKSRTKETLKRDLFKIYMDMNRVISLLDCVAQDKKSPTKGKRPIQEIYSKHPCK